MNSSKAEDDLLHHHLEPPIMDHRNESEPSILDHNHHGEPFSLPPMSEIVLFQDDDDESLSHTSSDADDGAANNKHNVGSAEFVLANNSVSQNNPRVQQRGYIDPEPHISTQFYTFNGESHALMIRCILEGRLATSDEIRAATPAPVLASWRAVWKDRNEDTAYLTAWKRIQDKLNVHVDSHGIYLIEDYGTREGEGCPGFGYLSYLLEISRSILDTEMTGENQCRRDNKNEKNCLKQGGEMAFFIFGVVHLLER